MDRDEQGRFLPGNQVARGNRGNRKPKWGNKNALKTGEYEKICFVNKEGQLVIQRPPDPVIIIPPGTFIIKGGRILIRKDVAEQIQVPMK